MVSKDYMTIHLFISYLITALEEKLRLIPLIHCKICTCTLPRIPTIRKPSFDQIWFYTLLGWCKVLQIATIVHSSEIYRDFVRILIPLGAN